MIIRGMRISLLIWILLLPLNLRTAEQILPGVRLSRLSAASNSPPGFSLQPVSRTGVNFTNRLEEEASARNRVLNNGSGVAAGDFDQDGLVDLFFCSLNQQNRLFKNLGNWKFAEVTESAGLQFPPLFYRGGVFADLDGNRWPDLLVGTVGRGVLCFLNDGRGRFTNATVQSSTASPFATETMALADIDGNGTLDLYVCNNRTEDIRDAARVPITYVNKVPTVPPNLRSRITLASGVLQEYGEPDILYLNDGRAHFRAVSFTNGAFFSARGEPLTETPLDWGLAAAFRDLNGDGAPDLYVCNDYWTPDRLWINGGLGRFKEAAPQAVRKFPSSSMGVDFADVNRDGHVDVFAVDMLSRSSEMRRRQTVAKRPIPPLVGDIDSTIQTPQNTLLLNRGDGTFAEIACFARLEASDWSWSPVFLDVDLDGFDDVLVSAGHLRDIQDFDANDRIRALQESWRKSPMATTNLQGAFVAAKREHAKMYPPLNMPVVAFRNRGDLRFGEVTPEWGLNEPGVNHGIALADLDNDGDLDVVVNRLGAPAALFQNNCGAPRVGVRLHGKAPNTQAIGAKIELIGGPVSNQIHEVTCGGSYMSGSDTRRVFATGKTSDGMVLRITWRDGAQSEITGVRPNHFYDIDENVVARKSAPPSRRPNQPPIFQDVSFLIKHTHHDEAFDDFARQPSLPRKFSQGGPGATWFDLNDDGWEDLIIGSGKGGTAGVFLNDNGNRFQPATNLFALPVDRDQTTVLGLKTRLGERVLLASSSAYEDGDTHLPPVRQINSASGDSKAILDKTPESTGPMALADLDGDGDLDLFVGGQLVPGRYPESASSMIYRQLDGIWSLDSANSALLVNVGLVSGAVWSDLNGDGFPELLLAGEWGPLKIFRNARGQLSPWNPQVRDASAGSTNPENQIALGSFTGLWQSITTGDFDGDGLLDIVAGNWGLNSCWRASAERPLTMFYGDFSGRDGVEILECEYDSERGQLAPRHLRDAMATSIPWIAEKFPTHNAWSRATVAELLEGRVEKIKEVRVATLATMVFLNRKDHFELATLPAEAQLAPVFGISVTDVDGDGREDLLLAQNFFAFRLEDSRLDAGRALLLRGKGNGIFAAVSGDVSGIKVYGEQRGAAVADFNHDGRPDWVVTQNGAATKLFRNRTGRPGLRVRLLGPAGNSDAVGAIVRLKIRNDWGPAREIRAGSGYRSQDSSFTVLALPEPSAAIQIYWPGGKQTEHPLGSAGREVTIKQ